MSLRSDPGVYAPACLALFLLALAQPALAAPLQPPSLSGLLQAGFAWDDREGDPGGTFLVRRARLKASGTLGDPGLGYVLQADFAAPQKPLRDGYLSLVQWGQELRVGQFKVPFGWEAGVSINRLPLIEYSLVSRIATPVNGWDLGAGVFGSTGLGDGWLLQNAIAVVNGEGPNTRDVSPHKDVYGRLGVLKKERFWVGVSGAGGDTRRDGAPASTRRAGGDVGVYVGPLLLVSEYTIGRFEDEESDVLAQAFYVLAIAKVIDELELVARYDAAAGEWEHLRYLTGGTTFSWKPFGVRLQVNYRHALTDTGSSQALAQAEYTF